MTYVYIAVRNDYFIDNPFPKGAVYGDQAMAKIWGIPSVSFIRNNHPDGDLYRIIYFGEFTKEDEIVLTLQLKVGKIVTNIDAVRNN